MAAAWPKCRVKSRAGRGDGAVRPATSRSRRHSIRDITVGRRDAAGPSGCKLAARPCSRPDAPAQCVCGWQLRTAVARMGCCTSLLYRPTGASKKHRQGSVDTDPSLVGSIRLSRHTGGQDCHRKSRQLDRSRPTFTRRVDLSILPSTCLVCLAHQSWFLGKKISESTFTALSSPSEKANVCGRLRIIQCR